MYWRISHRVHLSEVFQRPLRDPLRVPFPLIAVGLAAPNRVAPLKLLFFVGGSDGNPRENPLKFGHQKIGKEEKPINIKNFGVTPPGLCPICPVDMSHHLSRLSRGHSECEFPHNRPKRPGCPWDVPNLSPGRSQGIPTTKFLYVTFLYRFFVLHKNSRHISAYWPVQYMRALAAE